MKTQRILPGIILIGFGLYFFMQQSAIEIFPGFYRWPTLLCIVGIAFLTQAYAAKDHESILPGVILFGFGLHFHVVGKYENWPNDIGVFIFIIAVGFILRARKTNTGMVNGILLLVVSILTLFYDKVFSLLGDIEPSLSGVLKFWPFLLMAVGGYILFIKKK
jgi:hypothetical protein